MSHDDLTNSVVGPVEGVGGTLVLRIALDVGGELQLRKGTFVVVGQETVEPQNPQNRAGI